MENKIVEKKICTDCGIEQSENRFYLTPKGIRLDICKDCFTKEIRNSEDCFQIFKKYDIPVFIDLFLNTGSDIGEYIRQINSLPQYKYKTWKDSILHKEENEVEIATSFYDEIIKNLKEEAKKLNKKLTIINSNNGDYNTYIAILKSLRETLELIHKYDWHLDYSEYEVLDDNDNKVKQVSVWEQNYDNQIRNHKFWNVINEINKITSKSSNEIDNALKNI